MLWWAAHISCKNDQKQFLRHYILLYMNFKEKGHKTFLFLLTQPPLMIYIITALFLLQNITCTYIPFFFFRLIKFLWLLIPGRGTQMEIVKKEKYYIWQLRAKSSCQEHVSPTEEHTHIPTLVLKKTRESFLTQVLNTTLASLKHTDILICIRLNGSSIMSDSFIFSIIILRKNCKEPFHSHLRKRSLCSYTV